MIHAAITHFTKREQNTLGPVVASLHNAGIYVPRLYIDDGRFGCKRNFERAIMRLSSVAEAGDYVTILQDDMVPCEAAGGILAEAMVDMPGCALAMYTPAHNVRHAAQARGWVQVKEGWGAWGNQFMLPANVAKLVVAHDFFREHMANENDQQHTDSCMWETLKRLGVPVYAHVPSLFDHIGTKSTIGNEHGPATAGYRFSDWANLTIR